ncbi:MAG: hypothetical protein NC111_05620 [Bacteroides sp.]|nr:hypothetical protein [Bacteroides sp.]MCM1471988.1 hypothetical protein [Bacteroides sp.]
MSVSLFSCGNGAEGKTADSTADSTVAVEEVTEVVETVAADSTAADSTVAPADSTVKA